MIPHKDLEQLVQYYKGELTENALLNKAANARRSKTCLVSQSPITPGPGQCSNQTVESRINQVNQTHSSISRRRGSGAPGGTSWRRRRRRGRGFGDGTRGTMVEAHDKRRPVGSQTHHYPCYQGRSSHLLPVRFPLRRETFYQSRGYPVAFRSHSRTAQDLGKKVSREW